MERKFVPRNSAMFCHTILGMDTACAALVLVAKKTLERVALVTWKDDKVAMFKSLNSVGIWLSNRTAFYSLDTHKINFFLRCACLACACHVVRVKKGVA